MPGGFRAVDDWRQTGRCRPRVTVFARVKLEIEEGRRVGVAGNSPEIQWQRYETRWRPARAKDLLLAPPWQIGGGS
jgi:hypothetical protein